MINLSVNFFNPFFKLCIFVEFIEILNIEKVLKEEEDEVKEECVDKGIQGTFLHISQELYIIIQYIQTYVSIMERHIHN